ncbi:MAG TPA: hypothetical protein PLV68_04550, partial [Ilumatobacteraceae bacterium]|nr:hypothetical protein [Ilumatobacteraceae bacterium]
RHITITGRIVDTNGDPLTTELAPLDFLFWSYDVNDENLGGWASQVGWDENGIFQIEADINVIATSIELFIGGEDGEVPSVTGTFDPGADPTTVDVGDYEYPWADSVPVDISGVWDVYDLWGDLDSDLRPETLEVEVIPYAFDPSDVDEEIPYTRLAAPPAKEVGVDHDSGGYGASFTLPHGTTLIDVRVTNPDNGVTYSAGYYLGEFDGHRVTLEHVDFEDRPSHFTVEYTTFSGPAVLGDDDEPECMNLDAPRALLFRFGWAWWHAEEDVGAPEPFGRRLIIPDPETGKATVTVGLPVDADLTEFVHTEDAPLDLDGDPIYAGIDRINDVGGSGGLNFDFSEVVGASTGLDHRMLCHWP